MAGSENSSVEYISTDLPKNPEVLVADDLGYTLSNIGDTCDVITGICNKNISKPKKSSDIPMNDVQQIDEIGEALKELSIKLGTLLVDLSIKTLQLSDAAKEKYNTSIQSIYNQAKATEKLLLTQGVETADLSRKFAVLNTKYGKIDTLQSDFA